MSRKSSEPASSAQDRERIAQTIRALLAARAAGASICPSEVARALAPDGWRARMDEVRAVARELAARGELRVTQRGVPLDPAQPWRGPIRLALPPRHPRIGDDLRPAPGSATSPQDPTPDERPGIPE